MDSTTEDDKDSSPPEAKRRYANWAFFVAFVGLMLAVSQLCFDGLVCWSDHCPAYLGLILALTFFVLAIYIRHEVNVHHNRLEDKSMVEASIVEATTVEPRLLDPSRPENIEEKKANLSREIDRLQKMGDALWTEYAVLSLNQMLVDFSKPQDLIATTNSVMDDLDEYATDSKYQYDRENYAKWRQRVDDAVKKIDDSTGNDADDKSEQLRAVLKTLHEHLADYKLKWAQGSALVRDLLFVNAAAIPIFLTIGLVPVLHQANPGPLGVINWAMLGVTGALVGWLRSLHESDVVEVGNTQGKREIWRAVSGTALGFVAGALTYGIIAGGLIDGAAVPGTGPNPLTLTDVGLTIVWGVAAGFSFERVFERVGTATAGSN